MTRGCIQVASFIQKMWTINKTKESAVESVIETDPSYVEVVITVDAEATQFPAFFFKTTELSPLTWWKGLRKYNFPEGFCFC